ncbi:AP-1 complex subunit sigma-3 isoform A [Patagioenas fasciata monilis]|uniref:AP-1 complex subunit sigma-3 isoform A n=1 Tax=Patagioenas fasciata monilis TaxID=372326 RepID=A0A1V4K438_PATFA|nr:AP-1 complex subunit sigma-3 isoform A [Patagioenas fasciata monilis]
MVSGPPGLVRAGREQQPPPRRNHLPLPRGRGRAGSGAPSTGAFCGFLAGLAGAGRSGAAPGPLRPIHFILLFSRQGKLRLQKWYTTLPDKEKKKIVREIVQIILSRNQKTSSFVDWKDLKLVYKRYASLYFCCAIEDQDNELLTLEVVHRYVELLDRYFGNVCELDIIFNFEKAYFILDEFIIGGEVQETSKRSAVKAIEDSDMLQETVEEYMNKPAF